MSRKSDQPLVDTFNRLRCLVCNQPIMYVRKNNRWRWVHQDKTIRHRVQR